MNFFAACVYLVGGFEIFFIGKEIFEAGKSDGYETGFKEGSASVKKPTKVMPKVIIITPPCQEGPAKTEIPKDWILWRI